jgi:hypothetical protein
MNVPWCGWGEGWQALQVFDYKVPSASDNGLKIRVSVVRFRPWPPLISLFSNNSQKRCAGYANTPVMVFALMCPPSPWVTSKLSAAQQHNNTLLPAFIDFGAGGW